MNGIKSLNANIGERRHASFNGHRPVSKCTMGRIPAKLETMERSDSKRAPSWHQVTFKKTVGQ